MNTSIEDLSLNLFWALPGVLAYLFWRTLQYVCSNYVTLSGLVVDRLQHELENRKLEGIGYVLRVQNMESVPFEHPVIVRISAILTSSVLAESSADRVRVYAGAKGFSTNVRNVDARFVWEAETQILPAFDTWTFECRLPAGQVCFEVIAKDQTSRNIFKTFIAPDIAPTKLDVYKTDTENARIDGPTMVPRLVLPVMVSLLAVTFHLSWLAMSSYVADRYTFELSPQDASAIGLELVGIWIAYLAIRRPSQPFMAGYRLETRIDRRQKSEAST